MYQYSAGHNAVFARKHFRADWDFRTNDRVNGGLSVVGDTVYAVSFDKHIYALDAATGKLRWRSSVSNILMSTPVVSENVVVVGTGHNGPLDTNDATSNIWGDPAGDEVVGFAANDGHRLWTFKTIGEDMPSAAIANETVIIANGDLHAYGLDLRTGRQRWRTDLPGIDAMASVTVDRDLAFVGTCQLVPNHCATLALRIETGDIVWHRDGYGGSDASAALGRGVVLTDGNQDGTDRYRPGGIDVVSALDESTGRVLWERHGTEGPYTLVASAEHHIAGMVADGILYQAIANSDEVIALDIATGREVWSVRTTAPVKMSPVATDTRVYFGDTAGLLYDVNRATGEIIHTSALEKPFSTAPFVIVGDTLFLASGDFVAATPLDQL